MKSQGWALIALLCLIAACAPKPPLENEANPMSQLHIASTAFSEGGLIPKKYTCLGLNINPPLSIEGIPPDTKSLALIVDDPDAPMGTWTHWVLFNIPRVLKIEENSTPPSAIQGMTSSQDSKYSGPCPPSGTHRYFFRLYALDTALALGKGASREQLEQAMHNHILGQATTMGRYQRG